MSKAKDRTPRQIREALGFDRRSWARVLGVTPKTIERWDIGVCTPVGLADEIMRALNQVLNEGVPGADIHSRITLGLGAFIATELVALAKKRTT